MSTADRIPTDGGSSLRQNPFGALGGLQGRLPAAKPAESGTGGSAGEAAPRQAGAARNRGRVDIRRVTAGRGGKTVTVVSGFTGIGLPEKEQLAKRMQKACGTGGTVKDGRIEIQGDRREAVAKILSEAGFRPVFAGG